MRTPRRRIRETGPRPRWGRFEPGGRVYRVISTDTPRPWTNLFTNGTYGAFFSQHGLGFSFHRAPKICELTRWTVNESRPSYFDAGRIVFVKDRATGRFWAGNPQPGEGKLYRGFRCRHGLGWSEISAEREGLAFSYRFFVPVKGNLEIWTATVTNRSRRVRRIALVPAVELPTRATYLRARGRFDHTLRAIRAFQPGDRAWRRMDAHLFFGLDRSVRAWDVSRAAFWGAQSEPRRPGALESGLTKSTAENEWMVAALETHATLAPGASFTFNGILGYAERDVEAARILRKYRHRGVIGRAFEAVRREWERKTSLANCTLPDRDVARYLSIWGKNAVNHTACASRAQQIGYRDALQDLRGYLLVDPAYVRGQMLWLLGFVRRDGRGLRAIDPWRGQHNLDDYRDNPVWAAELASAYVKEIGDLDVLDEVIPYFEGGKGPLWDHLVRIVARLMKLRGEHGLVLVGGGDWNDALGPFGARGRGESAWLSLLVVRALRLLAEMADVTGRTREARRLRRWREELARAFNASAWDGAWYVYGWDDDGAPIGSRRCAEGKIHANVQSWALMERVVPPAREKKLWASIRKYLWTDAGLLTCWPAYVRTQPAGARIRDLGSGWYENAAVYCHGTAFYMAACAASGRGDETFRAIEATLPTNPRNLKSGAEPFGVTNFYVGPESRYFGRAPHSWFTGSAAWLLFVGWEGLVGIRPDFAGLRVAPSAPRAWTRWRATRRFRGATYEFSFRKGKGASGSRVRRLVVDGTALPGSLVPAFTGGTHRVEVHLA